MQYSGRVYIAMVGKIQHDVPVLGQVGLQQAVDALQGAVMSVDVMPEVWTIVQPLSTRAKVWFFVQSWHWGDTSFLHKNRF